VVGDKGHHSGQNLVGIEERGLDYATKKTLIATLGWNLLIVIKALLRIAPTGKPLSALVAALFALCAGIQSLSWKVRARDRHFKPRSQALSMVTVWKAGLSGSC